MNFLSNRKYQSHQNTSPMPKILLPTSNLIRYGNSACGNYAQKFNEDLFQVEFSFQIGPVFVKNLARAI